MKNKEKYTKEIIEVACSGDSIAVTKGSERIVKCGSIACSECLFEPPNCVKEIREWVEQEYIEKPVISKRDRAFLDYINANLHYIARDLNDDLYVYIREPFKVIDCWESAGCEINRSLQMIDINFPMVKWSDKKPWLIEDLKNLEVVDSYE